MTAQISGNVAPDSLLYSFTPAAVGRVGSPGSSSLSVVPTPLGSARRQRAQSVPGEPLHRGGEFDEPHTDVHPPSPRTANATVASSTFAALSSSNSNPTTATTAPVANNSSTNPSTPAVGAVVGGPLSAAALGPRSMPVRPPTVGSAGLGRCGSADRHPHSPGNSLGGIGSLSSITGGGAGSGGMPLIGVGGSNGGVGGLPPMRHSISGNPGIGLPKLDLPAIAFCGGGGGALPSSGRRSLNGSCCDAAAAAPPLDGVDGSAPPSPTRSSAPAVLAPLRVSGAFGCSGGGGGSAGASSLLSPAAPIAGDAAAGGGGGGLCSSGGGGLFASPSSRRYTPPAGLMDTGGGPYMQSPLLPCTSEGGLATPLLAPGLPTASESRGPPRRAHSLSSRGLAGGGGGGTESAADSGDGSAPAAAFAADGDLAASAGKERVGSGGGHNGMALTAMYDINHDMQRAAGTLLALHAPTPGRPRSAGAPAAAAPPPQPLTATQLAALTESAPELQWELRVAVRRIFQVLRQELSAAVPGGWQLGSAVHECWATLDAYLEGTTELTCSLVEGALEARQAAAAAASAAGAVALSPAAGSGNSSNFASGGGGGGGSVVEGAKREEAERLRSANEELRRQLEECRARMAKAEAAVAAVRGSGGGDGAVAAAASGTGSRSTPRPPAGVALPPFDNRGCNPSPRRGKHALVQPIIDGSVGGAAAASAAADGAAGPPPLAPSPSAPAVGGSGLVPAPPSTRRIDRAAVLARGASCDEMVIEGEASSEDSDVEDDSTDARRRMLTYHSASFAEWVRGARRR